MEGQLSFLSVLDGGIKDEWPNVRGKIDALEAERCQRVDQEGKNAQAEATVVEGSELRP